MTSTAGFPGEAFEGLDKGVALVDFNAPWCGPCRSMEPIIAGLEKAYSGRALVLKMNVDEHRDLATKLGIQSIPTLLVLKEGQEISRFVGTQSATTLAEALNAALAQ